MEKSVHGDLQPEIGREQIDEKQDASTAPLWTELWQQHRCSANRGLHTTLAGLMYIRSRPSPLQPPPQRPSLDRSAESRCLQGGQREDRERSRD